MSLMQYLPPVDQGSAQQMPPAQPASKPLDLAAARTCYYGKKAFTYDVGRENDSKWQKEYAAVEHALQGMSGTVLDIPCGTGRFFPIYKKLSLGFSGMDVSEDMMLQARSPEGQEIPVRISDVKDDSIVVDLNHPLAGKDLKFDVKVVSIE